MRVLRRRLGLTQRELAYVVGHDSDSGHVSRIENGSRTPQLAEVLMFELVFGVPATTIFPQVRLAVGNSVAQRLKHVTADLRGSASLRPRVSYKAAQLERVLASLRSRDGIDRSGLNSWHSEI